MLAVRSAWAADNVLPPPPQAPHLDFVADHLDYDRSNSMLHLKGAVIVHESTWTLKGDEVWINTQTRRGRSEGHLFVDNGLSAVSGRAGEFDFVEHSGVLYTASAGYGDWRVHAKSMALDPEKRLYYAGADFTSCYYVPPHYHFHATHMTVLPNEYLTARNVLFYIGPVPVFYLPYLYKSISKSHFLRFKFQPGYDHRNGAFLKGTLTTQHSPTWRSKLFLDYFNLQGVGAGGEISHRAGLDSRGILTGYRIKENTTSKERWFVNGDFYQGFLKSFAAQGQLQAMSDPNFNNDYARASLSPVTMNLINNGALVWRLPKVTSRLSYSREDDAVSTTTFVKTQETSPRLDVNSAPLTFLGLPWLNTLSGFAANSFTNGLGYFQKTVGGTWQATQTIPLTRSLKLTPSAQYGQTLYDRLAVSSTTTVYDANVGRYTLSANMRWISVLGNLDVAQTYTMREEVNSFTEDAGAVDHGVETNMLTALHAYRPNRAVLVRFNSGYDFRVYRDHELGFRDRVQPITGDVYYTPSSIFNLTVRDVYQLTTGNQNCIFSGTLGDELGTFLTAGMGYNLATADLYYLNTEFGISDSTGIGSKGTWHLTAALRSLVLSEGGIGDVHGFRVFEKEVMLVKNWHDFFGRASVRLRPGNVEEFTVRAEMKYGSFDQDRQIVHDWESEWFPERVHGREDRP